MGRSATVHDLRRRNRATVLRTLLLAGESTRAALAEAASLSTATLTNVVSDLIAEDLVEEIGQIPSDGGRPIARLSPRGVSAYFIGADVGEHGVTVELFDLQLRRVDRVFVRVRPGELDTESTRQALGEALDTVRKRNPLASPKIRGLGLGLPGVVETSADAGTVVDTQSLGWEPIDLTDLVDAHDLPLYAENGAKTMAMAEAWSGAARGTDHNIAALLGRGVGAGIIHGGRLLRGFAGSAGEWGHTKIALHGRRCRCGSRGCLEAYVGGRAIIERWAEAGAPTTANEEGELTRLLDLADRGDDLARRVLDETVEIVGLGLANLVNTLNPEVIVIGGWVGTALAEARMEEITHHMNVNSLVRPADTVRLELSGLGSDAVALGAALLPLQQFIEGLLPNTAER